MKKQRSNRLRLHRETVQNLSPNILDRARGGGALSAIYCHTDACNTNHTFCTIPTVAC